MHYIPWSPFSTSVGYLKFDNNLYNWLFTKHFIPYFTLLYLFTWCRYLHNDEIYESLWSHFSSGTLFIIHWCHLSNIDIFNIDMWSNRWRLTTFVVNNHGNRVGSTVHFSYSLCATRSSCFWDAYPFVLWLMQQFVVGGIFC